MTATPWCKTPSGARSLLAFLITLLLTLPAFSQTPIFPVLPFDFALFPSSTYAYADFNGDGQVDQAAPNGINAIGISFNNGANHSPTFGTIQLTCQPQSVVAADLNNDSKSDLAFSCQTPNQPAYIGVVLGNGDGTFQAASYYAVPGAASVPTLTTVDLNGDGYLDVAVLIGSSQVGVLLNQGSGKPGSLLTASLYAAPAGVSFLYISAGDFNGDGKQDIVAGNTQIAVYYGKGDGTLNTPQLTTASAPGGRPFVTGDFNRDGLADIAFLGSPAQGSATSLQVLLGDPSGKLVTGSNLPLDPSVNYSWIVPFQNTSTSNITNFALIGSVTSIALNDGIGNLSLGESYGMSTYAVAQAGSDGNTNLYFQSDVESVALVGNGNGTFQGPPTTLLGGGSGVAISADLNADGISDVLSIDSAGNLVAALGRGNGTFLVSSRSSGTGQLLVTGDFNGDGNLDAVTIFPGAVDFHGNTLSTTSLYFYGGNGGGVFQPNTTPQNLTITSALTPLVGDFNGDNKLDLILPYKAENVDPEAPQPPSGVLFLAGNGDGTFATPVSLPLPYNTIGFAADLNNDHKLDIIGGDTVSLGNGDGTFTQQPLGITGTILAVSDLNGDGKPDLVIFNNATSIGLYAGNGDGTFQTTPFYSTSAFSPQAGTTPLVAIGDVNGDGHPDLILQYLLVIAPRLQVLLGDGAGNFTPDSNNYPLGAATSSIATLARLNNTAPPPAADHALDYLYSVGGAVTSLLNQLNPGPSVPISYTSTTTLSSSTSGAAPGQQLTLTATVIGATIGATPTGSVSFVADGKILGIAPLTNGVATLAISFPAAGTFAVIANYPGDINSVASSSNPLSLAIAPVASKTVLELSFTGTGLNTEPHFYATVSGLNPTGTVTFNSGTTTLGTAPVLNGTASFTYTFLTAGNHPVTATYSGDVANLPSTSNTFGVDVPEYSITTSPISALVKAGQSATATFTVNPSVGYTGTLKFACGPLPTGVTCTFTPASITPSSGPATTTLTITTTAPTTALLRRLAIPLQGTALASFLFLILIPRRSSKWSRSGRLIALMIAAGLISLSGCSSSSPSSSGSNTLATPAGVYNVGVNITDSTSNVQNPFFTFQVTVQ